MDTMLPDLQQTAAQLALHALNDKVLRDVLSSQIDVPSTIEELQCLVETVEDEAVLDLSTPQQTATAQNRDIGLIWGLYCDQKITGTEMHESLQRIEKDKLVDFVMAEIVGWNPPKRRTRSIA